MNKVSTNSWIKFDVEKTTEACTVQSSCGLSRKAFTFFGAMLLTVVFLLSGGNAWGQKVQTSTFTVPANVDHVIIEAWGGGGAGGYSSSDLVGCGGGGGGAYARSSISVGQKQIKIENGSGGQSNSKDSKTTHGGTTKVYYNGTLKVQAAGGSSVLKRWWY